MNHLFVPHVESLELKELGFNKPCLGYSSSIHPEKISLDDNCFLSFYTLTNKSIGSDSFITRPTWSQVFDWFITEYNLDGYVHSYRKNYHFTIIDRNTFTNLTLYDPVLYGGILQGSGIEFDTTEQARLACLQKLIEIVKNK